MGFRAGPASRSAIAALLLALLSPLARATEPVWVYDIWSSYDELSDTVPLTEGLAMRELAETVRLKRLGVQIDYYLMDAFWYARDGGYRIAEFLFFCLSPIMLAYVLKRIFYPSDVRPRRLMRSGS